MIYECKKGLILSIAKGYALISKMMSSYAHNSRDSINTLKTRIILKVCMYMGQYREIMLFSKRKTSFVVNPSSWDLSEVVPQINPSKIPKME